ncbi:MAG: Asp23/Gls24 family envelope stress response protein [Bacillota bacterium]
MSEQDYNINSGEANSKGTISYANDVIATIAGLAAMEASGVAGMSGGVVDGIVELVGRKNLTKGIKVEVGNHEAAIDAFVVIQYGAKIQEVAGQIQESVKKAVENMTGLKVVEVNVHVQGIQFEKEVKEPEPPRVR